MVPVQGLQRDSDICIGLGCCDHAVQCGGSGAFAWVGGNVARVGGDLARGRPRPMGDIRRDAIGAEVYVYGSK